MPPRKTDSSPYKVQVLERVLSIIDALTKVRADASVTELAERVKLHKSTAHRLLSILERHRIVERDSETGRYRLGLRLFELGTIAMDRFNIRDRARPYLESLLEEVIEPARSVRMASRIGHRKPVHCTAVGKVILAHLSEAEQDSILQIHGLPRLTPKTITTASELKGEFKPIRERGYALDNEETEQGLRCIGAAVLDHSGRPVAAISVSAPSFRLTMEKVPLVAGPVARAARVLSEELGFRPESKREFRKPVASIR